jgi:hypothetical protein
MGSPVPSKPERRSQVRLLCSELVFVEWETAPGSHSESRAILEDISPSGACLQLEAPVSKGARITIHVPQVVLAGRVCYCVFRDYGYFIGVQFDDGSKWSPARYKPQHLLDPRTLGDIG